MPAEQRVNAAELFWEDDQSTDQQLEAVAAIASHMKFRTKSVLSLAADKRAKYLSTLPNVSDTIAARALVNYHLGRQRPMMAAFLDSVGVAHEDGLITEENVTKPDAEKLKSAAADLATKFPREEVALYLSTLSLCAGCSRCSWCWSLLPGRATPRSPAPARRCRRRAISRRSCAR
jgi:hypothetical protein